MLHGCECVARAALVTTEGDCELQDVLVTPRPQRATEGGSFVIQALRASTAGLQARSAWREQVGQCAAVTAAQAQAPAVAGPWNFRVHPWPFAWRSGTIYILQFTLHVHKKAHKMLKA